MSELDSKIRDVLDVFGLLLVFVAGLLSFLMARAVELAEADVPDVRADRDSLVHTTRGTKHLAGVLLAMVAAVLTVSVGTTWQTLQTFRFGLSLSPLRAGFVTLVFFLVLAGCWAGFTIRKLSRRIRELQG